MEPIQAHKVKCWQCGQEFDIAREAYYAIPTGSTQRYIHVACADEFFKKRPERKPTAELIDPENDLFCPFCKKKIDRTKDLYRRLPGGWFGHEECCVLEDQRKKTPEEELCLYIMKLYDIPFVTPYMKRQIEKYRVEYQYTYTGMLRSLRYWYDVKKIPFDKSKGVGIIPYIYQEAYDYYYAIWQANQQAKEAEKTIYKPIVEEVTVGLPSRPQILKKLFNSVDKDIIDGQ